MFDAKLLDKYKMLLDHIKPLYTEDCRSLVVTFGPDTIDIEPIDEDECALAGIEFILSELQQFNRDEFIAVLEHIFGEVLVEEDEF
ncbi:MAG: hypothetical protein ACI35O_03770 [Bacillaceae bacterium]